MNVKALFYIHNPTLPSTFCSVHDTFYFPVMMSVIDYRHHAISHVL